MTAEEEYREYFGVESDTKRQLTRENATRFAAKYAQQEKQKVLDECIKGINAYQQKYTPPGVLHLIEVNKAIEILKKHKP